jgi:hypothetical protein
MGGEVGRTQEWRLLEGPNTPTHFRALLLTLPPSLPLLKNWTLQMKHVAAYILLATGGNASPSAADVTELLATVE